MTDDARRRLLREEYTARINRVIDYIEANIDKSFTLEELARVANFSRFHFHRLFGAVVGETLNHFIQRIRLEKAATQLIGNPKKSITEIVYDCGFSSSASFARAFRETFRMSASQWRSGGHGRNRKERKTIHNEDQLHGKIGKDFDVSSDYLINGKTVKQKWRIVMKGKSTFTADVEVKDLPDLHVAYIRHIGPYAGDKELFDRLFTRLFKWAGARDLLRFPETQVLAVYYDNPEITDEDRLRLDVCITVPEETPVDGEVGKMVLPGGKYAMARFELASDEYPDAWSAVCSGWLPESGYQPDDRPAFELYLNDPKEHPEGKCILDICLPVKPL